MRLKVLILTSKKMALCLTCNTAKNLCNNVAQSAIEWLSF